jgi:hypothetical protein
MALNTGKYLFVYREGARNAVTVLDKETLICPWTGQSKEDIMAEEPDLEFLEYEEFSKRVDRNTVTEPQEITQEQFIEALNCLPPLNWYCTPTFECFHMSEFMVSHYTATYAHTAHRFFMWTDTALATVDQIKEKLFNKFPELRS